jgi:site-specific DNA-methyltransferase (adenine-specific)
MSKIIATNEDNMLMMARYPDNYFELSIVDPPYGINADRKNSIKDLKTKESAKLSKDYGNQNWDNSIPNDKYFQELKRVSKKQIIWGANFFNLQGGMLYWHKNVTMPTYSTGELAYLSWLNKIDFVEIRWHGMLQHDMKNKEVRIHPTQKPVKLYEWILMNYAKEGDKILDTHRGSASLDIACHNLGFDLVTCELDTDYFNDGNKRLKQHQQQQVIKF